ncbi:HAD-IA family hydrolase [Luteibacter anthropi]|uniref:HAD-IA family hydrolase n=1 Tax=Luteibacter anthropi TaxID=564369 RepID=A0A7X5ZIF7_9GAMM|nr:HAD-IA family hydrolase [Luteibacter anthropi]NII06666.1 HAD-IA family hydrolase [Luteibacter anthropi]URX60866.1 HAD-IA family hydrolase [Luteibacter anthropi]
MRLESGTVIETTALLFDMDGTLVDSRVVVEKIWKRWCDAHGLDWDYVLPRLHGVRMYDSVKEFTPAGYDVEAEFEKLYKEELEDVDGIVPIPGAVELLASLPPDAWTIVTSADTPLALARLGAAGIKAPPRMVAGEMVANGKPHPEPYLLGASRMNDTKDFLVFEDARAGIDSGLAAGGRVIAIAGDHPEEVPDNVEWVTDLTTLRYAGTHNGKIHLHVL